MSSYSYQNRLQFWKVTVMWLTVTVDELCEMFRWRMPEFVVCFAVKDVLSAWKWWFTGTGVYASGLRWKRPTWVLPTASHTCVRWPTVVAQGGPRGGIRLVFCVRCNTSKEGLARLSLPQSRTVIASTQHSSPVADVCNGARPWYKLDGIWWMVDVDDAVTTEWQQWLVCDHWSMTLSHNTGQLVMTLLSTHGRVLKCSLL